MTVKKKVRLLRAEVEIEQDEGKTAIRFRGRSLVSTKKLLTFISVLVIVSLTLFAQVSSIGRVILDMVQHLFPF